MVRSKLLDNSSALEQADDALGLTYHQIACFEDLTQ
jgi:hypothetical protein